MQKDMGFGIQETSMRTTIFPDTFVPVRGFHAIQEDLCGARRRAFSDIWQEEAIQAVFTRNYPYMEQLCYRLD